MTRAALYLRVSKDAQHTDNQRPELEALAHARRFDVVAEYVEHASAAKGRPVFDRMLKDAHARRFDVLLVWALDRFGRSMVGNLSALLDLDRRGVVVVSVREPWLDAGGAVRPLLIAIVGWVAEQERAQLVARTKAGLDRARRRRVKLGRPRVVHRQAVDLAVNMQARGMSIRGIARALDIPPSTIYAALRRRAENGA
jgi:DNA invertase Pin-like site-specific DNA recombinase